MKPLTEQDIRGILKQDGTLQSLTISKDTLVTPSAAEYLRAKHITLNIAYDAGYNPKAEALPSRVFYGPDGDRLDHKSESMTHLHGNHLVYKDHPLILWRGKLDSLTALIIESQELGAEQGNQAFVDDLQEILIFVRSLLPCEYKNILVKPVQLLGLSLKDVQDRSHNPLKYYGYPHILCDFRMGSLSIRLNRLRTLVRETELAAVAAFRSRNGTPIRKDIIEALNRLSSLFYILMYKYLSKNFTPDSTGI